MRAFLVAPTLALFIAAAASAAASASEPAIGFGLMQGSWAVDSAPGVFGLSRRLTVNGNQIIRPDAPFATTISSVFVSGDWLAIRFQGPSGMLLRRETPDRLCGWGPLGPIADMRTSLNRANPPFCLVRLNDQPAD